METFVSLFYDAKIQRKHEICKCIPTYFCHFLVLALCCLKHHEKKQIICMSHVFEWFCSLKIEGGILEFLDKRMNISISNAFNWKILYIFALDIIKDECNIIIK